MLWQEAMLQGKLVSAAEVVQGCVLLGRVTALSPLNESLGALGIPSPGSTHFSPEMGMSCGQAAHRQHQRLQLETQVPLRRAGNGV